MRRFDIYRKFSAIKKPTQGSAFFKQPMITWKQQVRQQL
jgi:hypothetical protein